ncbi:hypothetical protein [Vibrio parahaemolyticus]|uniref:hypothetical protein n=4 Tax=Vibrio parahaemolyticus TaxID=670 RepID=UPI0007A0491C|nr:hypothetical protein [Vibrio parahaemolyticus]EGQ7741089.1 hypothetical protein [Vibrio parahaemolyticus]EIO3966897.1 hypothetical protein [Vibrio parahaemolyticus]EIO3989764.1 hypothetical protein [Vibrio parahaemolyticus]EJG1399152.1 hypothetical protein [Vibrio parahaemolyticus]ELA9842152.1 hypothetical protein [Vibrio parahaemolyticus]
MSIDRPKLYKKLEENEIEKVLFTDPLSETTRKSRRNLMIASVMCLLISILNLKVTGFLGLKAETDAIESELVKGIGAIIVIYYFVVFILYATIDLLAWKFDREKTLISGHQELVEAIERHFSVTIEHIDYSVRDLSNLSPDSKMQDQIYNSEAIGRATQLIQGTKDGIDSFRKDAEPFINQWLERVNKTSILNTRFFIRLVSLYGFDLIFPSLMAFLAVYKSYTGILLAVTAIFS